MPANLTLVATMPDIDPAARVTATALSWPAQARALVITDPASYTRAAELLAGVRALQKEVAATFDPICEATDKAHKAATGGRRAAATPLAEAETILKDGMIAFDRAARAAAAAEDARRRAIAAAEEETRRLEELALQVDAADGDETALAEVAADLEQLVRAPAPVVVAPVVKATPVVAGIAFRACWKFRVANDALVPVKYKTTDEKKIRAVVNALGLEARIPGVEVWADTTLAARR